MNVSNHKTHSWKNTIAIEFRFIKLNSEEVQDKLEKIRYLCIKSALAKLAKEGSSKS